MTNHNNLDALLSREKAPWASKSILEEVAVGRSTAATLGQLEALCPEILMAL